MKKIKQYGILFLAMVFLSSCSLAFAASETQKLQKKDIFTYTVSKNEATITNVDDVRQRVVIPDTLGGFPVTALASGACGGSTTIQEIILPDSVTSIGSMCFAYSTELHYVQLPKNLAVIENGLFSQCIKLRTITIPSSVKRIERDAFYRCDELWTITLPKNLESVGVNAFAACPNLAAATIPQSVSFLGENAFEPAGGFRIYAKPGTAAERFAIEQGITFEELITVTVNDTPVLFDQPPITDTKNYRTLVPMRSVLTILGAEISWDNNLNMAGIDLLGNRLLIRIGEPFMMVNGDSYPLPSPAIEFNSRTLLPIRALIEAVGGTVDWNEEEKHITVTCKTE